ncbi:hypothetical protein NLJ89_g11812 [Agrocybe chaxingu]|uniref:Uncharacterized protein n=1 Tax=Agrocybe chaxingu TaxID=84603 RepID=A0A9W8JW30_9AGAR|nr:hypothetical protein NLJ89_g11812 [Agrocybe chaxingu]
MTPLAPPPAPPADDGHSNAVTAPPSTADTRLFVLQLAEPKPIPEPAAASVPSTSAVRFLVLVCTTTTTSAIFCVECTVKPLSAPVRAFCDADTAAASVPTSAAYSILFLFLFVGAGADWPWVGRVFAANPCESSPAATATPDSTPVADAAAAAAATATASTASTADDTAAAAASGWSTVESDVLFVFFLAIPASAPTFVLVCAEQQFWK